MRPIQVDFLLFGAFSFWTQIKIMEEKTQIEIYRELVAGMPENVEDVKAPSGFIFKFRKQNQLAVILSSGKIPHHVASRAVESWGPELEKVFESIPQSEADSAKIMLRLTERVLDLSYSPKIVYGQPQNPNEFCWTDICEPDFAFLMAHVDSGGELAALAANFPQEQGTGSTTSTNGAKIRKVTKRSNRTK